METFNFTNGCKIAIKKSPFMMILNLPNLFKLFSEKSNEDFVTVIPRRMMTGRFRTLFRSSFLKSSLQ